MVAAGGPVGAGATVMAWENGERDRWWARATALDHEPEQADWVKAVTSADRITDLPPERIPWLVAAGPEAPARALIAEPLLMRHGRRLDVGRVAAARFELDALPLVLCDAGTNPDQQGLLVLPFRGPDVATLVAGWLRHLGSARLWARLWLCRHAETAARTLIPAAAGRAGRARQHAEDALRFLAATGHGPIVATITEAFGAGAIAAIDALLGPASPAPVEGALFPIPADAGSTGKAPEWARPARLPELWRTGGGPVPEDEVVRLVTALSRSRLEDPPEPAPGDPAPAGSGLPLVVESASAAQPMVHPPDPETARLIAACDRRSLAEFGRALLDAWLTDGMPASGAWVVLAQAHIGDDATMEALAPLVRSWPARSRWARAIDGLAVLATAGTDVALRHLLAIEAGMAGGPTNERAIVYLTQAVAGRGISVTQLADRLTVTHGLDTGITLDYGPRSFTVVTDEHLAPHPVDADGRRLARLPKPGVRDTDPDAYQQFARLKKDLRATATAQIARLQREMITAPGRIGLPVTHRRRPARHLCEVVLPHPILGPLARRLLWGEYDIRGHLARALRVAEDGSLADLDDTTALVPPDARLGVVHPAELGTDLAAWRQLFSDYEILQPFPQLHRPAVTLSPAERTATSLPGFGPVPPERMATLVSSTRWQQNATRSSQVPNTQLTCRLPGDLELVAELDPGLAVYTRQTTADQQITEIWVDHARSGHWQASRSIPLGTCDPVALSEALVELHTLRA